MCMKGACTSSLLRTNASKIFSLLSLCFTRTASAQVSDPRDAAAEMFGSAPPSLSAASLKLGMLSTLNIVTCRPTCTGFEQNRREHGLALPSATCHSQHRSHHMDRLHQDWYYRVDLREEMCERSGVGGIVWDRDAAQVSTASQCLG